MSDTENTPSFDPSVSGAPLVDWDSAFNAAEMAGSQTPQEAPVTQPDDTPVGGKITHITPAKEGEDLVAMALTGVRGLVLEPDADAPPALEATYVLPAVGGIRVTVATTMDGGIVMCFDFEGNPRFIVRQSAPMAKQFLTLLAVAVTQSRVFAGAQS